MKRVNRRDFLRYSGVGAAVLAVGCGSNGSNGPALPAAGELSRAEFAAMIADYFGWYHQSEYNDIWKVPSRTFTDVKATDRYGKQIECAYEENLVAPDTSGRFNPDIVMTRQDAAVIFVKAFFLTPASDNGALNQFTDAGSISDTAKPSVAALVAAGYMAGRFGSSFAPTSAITATEAQEVIDAIEASNAVAVQAMPKQRAAHLTLLPDGAGASGAAGAVDDATINSLLADRNYAPRRFIHLYTPTPGATIYYTTDGSDPVTSSTRQVYDVAATGHIQELVGDRSGAKGPYPYRLVTWKTVAVKDGVAISPVRTFKWNLYRPWTAVFNHDLIEQGNFDPAQGTIAPKVTRLCCDYESVRAMSWLIEGPGAAIVFDALQTPWNSPDQSHGTLYDLATSLTSKPLKLIIGHSHVDHYQQAQNFLNAGVPVYSNKRSWNALAGVLASKDSIKQVNNIDEGDQFDIGTAAVPLKLDVWALPGHENALVMLHHKVSGFLFATDIYGCTRMGTADNVNVSGVRSDLMLSLVMQVHAGYKQNGGKVTKLFTGHDESTLPYSRVLMFQQLFQNIVDMQEAANMPTLRSSDAPRARTTLIGNMFTDLYNWAAINIGGTFGTTPYAYLTAPNAVYSSHATIDYSQTNAHLKYGVLGNIELTGATLVGTTVIWAAQNTQVTLGDASLWPVEGPVPNSLTNKFNPWVYDYTVNVPTGQTSIGVAPIPLSSKVKRIAVNGNTILPETSTQVSVSNGTVITIVVTAPDGTTTETYTLTVEYV